MSIKEGAMAQQAGGAPVSLSPPDANIEDPSVALQSKIRHIARIPVEPGRMLIDGESRDASDGRTRPVTSPIHGDVFSLIPEGTPSDIDEAVHAARRAFESRKWLGLAPKERKRTLLRWADLMEAHKLELAVLETRDMGMPVQLALHVDLAGAVEAIRWYGEAIDKIYDEVAPTPDSESVTITRIPLGVVGAIVPWNFPAMIAAWKLGPAIAAGNSVVLKPSEEASLVIIRMAELSREAGLPAGVLNVVTGEGAGAGAALAAHNDVDCITFTGSGETGRKLLEASARSNLKRVSLECGGKTANIIMADAPDLTQAAQAAARAMFANQGQICNAPARLLVERPILEQVVEIVVNRARALRIGDPLDLATDLGPIVNQNQRQKILSAIDQACAEGTRFVLDGRGTAVPSSGFYVGPSVAVDVRPSSALAQEEVFGPVLAVIAFDTLDQAIAIANGTRYGLGAAFWSSDVKSVRRAAQRLLAGTVVINGIGGTAIELPFGGFKQSGFGRDRSLHAIDKYTDFKTVINRS